MRIQDVVDLTERLDRRVAVCAVRRLSDEAFGWRCLSSLDHVFRAKESLQKQCPDTAIHVQTIPPPG